jgi:hypothetical protein
MESITLSVNMERNTDRQRYTHTHTHLYIHTKCPSTRILFFVSFLIPHIHTHTHTHKQQMDDASRMRPGSNMNSALPESIFDVKSRLLVWAMKKKPGNSSVLQPRYFELKRTRETFLLSWYKDDKSKKSQKAAMDLRQVTAVYRPSREYRESGGDLSLDIVFPHKTYTILPKPGDPQSIRFIKLLSSLKPLKMEGWMMLTRKPSPSTDIREWEERHVRLNGSFLTYHKDADEKTKALSSPIDLCTCRILRPSRMGPCPRNDPSSIDIVQITGHRSDGAIRGKAALTLRQTYCPSSKNIANIILRFALLLTDKDPMNPENVVKQQQQEKTIRRSVKIEDQRARSIRTESTTGLPPPPTPTDDDLNQMMSSDEENNVSPPVR